MHEHSTASADRALPSPDDRALVPAFISRSAARRSEWLALTEPQRQLLTPDVVNRWSSQLYEEDWTLEEVATFERNRRSSLATLRSGAALSDREYQLLRFLQRNEGRNLSYLRIARHLWSTAERPVTPSLLRLSMNGAYQAQMIRTIHVIVHRIRRAIEIDPLRPQHLATIRGVGYRWYSKPPALDDGENYERRAFEIERDREEMRAVLGLVEGDYIAIEQRDRDGNVYETSVAPSPEHPDARLALDDADGGSSHA